VADPLFAWVERVHGPRPWGRVLDAGTGNHSLRWLTALPTECLTAVTAEESLATELRRRFRGDLRAGDRVVVGRWSDPALLPREVFDVVVADYLFGAVDRFEPYAQLSTMDQVLRRLARAGRLYVVGLQPHPRRAPSPEGELVLDLMRAKDSAFILSRDRTYREFPEAWIAARLEARGLSVIDREAFTIRCDARYIQTHARAALNLLRSSRVVAPGVAKALARHVERLRDELLDIVSEGPIPLGTNYVMALERPS